MKKKLAILALGVIALRLWVLAGGADALTAYLTEADEAAFLPSAEDTETAEETVTPEPEPTWEPPFFERPYVTPEPPAEEAPGEPAESPEPTNEPAPEILPTTIPGGLTIRNSTEYQPDIAWLLTEGASLELPKDGVQILIVHTHGSEAYTPDGVDLYEQSDTCRTEDKRYSVIRVGDELAEKLESYGLTVTHDREIYDYPSYTGSYSRSGEAVSAHLAAHPETAIVIDLHRDALGTDDVVYKTVAAVDGEKSSQLMLLVGTDDSGLEHPNWEENLKLALLMQQAVNARYPTLARPVSLVRERYNQHLTTGSLILEVGSSGNTLQEALSAVRLFADAVGPVLAEMVEK